MKRKDIVIDIGLICAFGGLIFFVQAGMMDKLDAFIYHLIAPLINSRLTLILKIVTAFGDTLFMIIITIILFWLLKPKGRGKDIAILMIVTTIINNIIKVLVKRPRPTILPLVIEKSYSFPSGHTMAAVTLASFLIYVIWQEWGTLKKTKCLLLSLFLGLYALAIIFSRIYLGAHFASDCLGAIILSNLIFHSYLTYFKPKF